LKNCPVEIQKIKILEEKNCNKNECADGHATKCSRNFALIEILCWCSMDAALNARKERDFGASRAGQNRVSFAHVLKAATGAVRTASYETPPLRARSPGGSVEASPAPGPRTSRTPGLVARTTRPGRAAAPGQSELLRRGARMWRRTTASQPLPAASLRRAAVRARPRCGFEFVHVQLLRTPICIAVVVAVMNRIIAG
jgi:hypothetical protein